VIPRLPGDLPVPVVVVQHMPPLFTRLLADRLNSCSPLTVQEGKTGSRLEPGNVWLAPGDFHMTTVKQGADMVLRLDQTAPENSCRPAVDVLFRSVAQAYGANVLAVILTGMGADGTKGGQAIRAADGEIIAQDEATSVVWGMPGTAVAAGIVDQVLPLNAISDEIVRRINMRRYFVATRAH
jgi:two-component system chemotaxis response regulator CheB